MTYLLVALLAMAASAIEAISYSGYVMAHTGMNPAMLYLVSLVLAPWAPSIPKPFHSLLRTVMAAVVIVFTVLIFAENFMYPNYIYSHLHINPYTLAPFIGLSLFHLLRLQQISIPRSLLIACLIYLGASGGGKTLALIASNAVTIVGDPFATYESKMTKAYPGFYPAIMRVKELTDGDATVLIPPQGNPWEVEGNAAMVTYFLYPREVHNLDPDAIDSLDDNTYLLISKGSWKRTGEMDYGWPKIQVPSLKLWEISQSGQVLNIYTRDYDPTTDLWDWGLIEVAHE